MARKGRGIDFEFRFKTSRWAEDLLLASLSATAEFFAIRYGLSAVVPESRLDYGDITLKEPDILLFRRADLTADELTTLKQREDLSNVNRDEVAEDGPLEFVARKACAAIEVEFSPYKAGEMKGRAWRPKTQAEWEKRPLKHAKPPTAPNIWVKQEDLNRLLKWQKQFGVPIIVAHLFDQEAFAIRLDEIITFDERLTADPKSAIMSQMTTGIFKVLQTYDRTDAQGAREQKLVYVVTPNVATRVGKIEGVKVEAQVGLSTSRKYVSHIIFSDGNLVLDDEFIKWIGSMK